MQENLEYDPERDGPRDDAHAAEWDARSIGSTDMLGGKSELGTMPPTPMDERSAYQHYPLPSQDFDSPHAGFASNVNLPFDNPSTDRLINQPDRSEDYRAPRRQGSRPYPPNRHEDPYDASPLLDYAQPQPLNPEVGGNVPYPPSAYTQPPVGYTPPTLRRTATDRTDASDDVAPGGTRWDGGGHADPYGAAPAYAQGGYGGYDDGQRGYAHATHASHGSGGSGGSGTPGYGHSARQGSGGYGYGGHGGHGGYGRAPTGYDDPYDTR